MSEWQERYERLAERLGRRGVAAAAVVEALKSQRIETPSWGYADSGTRFQVFHCPGAARTLEEKLQDAAQVHRYTGVCPSVAIHIPWDKVDDWDAIAAYAKELGLCLGAVNPNLFQEPEYKLGSVAHPDPAVRRKAVEHMLECVEIARKIGSNVLSLWFADGTNYAGQDNIRARKRRVLECLQEVYAAMPEGMRMLLEYKMFEPAFYHTDIADWGMSYAFCCRLGERAQVLVDLGHHALGTNIEHIVAFLIDEGRLGGFHFNNKKYADDDLIVGSVNPYELFLIFCELIDGERDPSVTMDVAYMIDQSHNIEPKIEAMIQSVDNIQVAYAKALVLDREGLAAAQKAGDVITANAKMREAFETDVTPLIARAREEMGLDPDPIAAFRASGYAERVAKERG